MPDARPAVLWFGPAPDRHVEAEFRNRGLTLVVSEPTVGLPSLRPVRCAVFALNEISVDAISSLAAKSIARLVDYGVRVELLAADETSLGTAQRVLGKLLDLDLVNSRIAPAPFEIPERAARHNDGAAPRLDLQIEVAGNRQPIERQDQPLFERAFWDCKKIVLSELTGGYSDARVFSVHATVDTSLAGLWPQPFFAKLDRREKAIREHRAYREFAERYIPFGLRPNIRDVFLGAERGLLVGDLVDKSESLWDLVRRDTAAEAISSLFNETLGGWRNQAYAADPQRGAVAVAMRDAGLCNPGAILPQHCQAAVQGGTAPPNQLWDPLTKLDQRYRLAPVHGDLHAENVRVRNGQAILIDFASVAQKGPLTTDLAALETWLAFELPPEEDKTQYENVTWRETVEGLYSPASFLHPPAPAEPMARYAWLTSAVRQIRHIGIGVQSCPTEYLTAVAVQLLRRCQWDDKSAADRFRRAHGYATASRLIRSLTDEGAST